ncbi:MAG: two-component system regulatory protein YycI [Eubacterium sp.]|nr:two-component system regulatory protein YycI [Eubacterium sp.]
MDWNKAKNYTIILLLILNAVLLGLNLAEDLSRRLSKTEVENIIAVLESNNITVETEVPQSAESLPQLNLAAANYSLFDLVNIFFKTDERVKRTEEFNATIFKTDDCELRVDGDIVTYTDKGLVVLTAEKAEETAREYMERLNELFPEFSYEYTAEAEGELRVKYDMRYKGNDCFNNFCEFKFGSGGMTVSLRYLKPLGFSGAKSEVYCADVILLSFMNGIREIYPDEHLTVSKLELGYLAKYEKEGETSEAIPYYRIILKEKSEVCYINGYTAVFSTA